MKFYNTLSRHKERFEPQNTDAVKLYTCGPTVYSYAHIGNLRAYIFMDLLRRVLKINGYKTLSVLNITDVGHLLSDGDEGEDKMQKAARESQQSPYEIAEKITKVFFDDLRQINVAKPDFTPKATDHIAEMIDYVVALVDKGYAYVIDDGVYFDISKFAGYGKLSGQKREEKKAGARIKVNNQKRNADDFALWKTAEPNHIMQWQSPWGMGYPGWHIECSVMSEKYLGTDIDIHTGGIDHVPIHHENEIAQSESFNGKQTVKTWMHSEFMMVDGGRMGKSLGNGYTLADLHEKGFEPLDFRYFCLNAHYRQKLNFTWEGLAAAKTARARLREQVAAHKDGGGVADTARLEAFKSEFLEAINDDLNIPSALGVLWKAVKEPKSAAVYDLILFMDEIFGLDLDRAADEILKGATQVEPVPPQVQELLDRRKVARTNKDFAASDTLRDEILRLGYKVLDTKQGQTVEKL